MSTILNLLVEKLDIKIDRLKSARQKLREKNLEDVKLEHQIHRLVSMRNRLHNKPSTEGGEIDSGHTPTPGQTNP